MKTSFRQNNLTLRCVFSLFIISCNLLWTPTRAAVECTNDDECETILRKGSVCADGLCTNPFHNGGCLKSYIPDWHKTRICNSDDPPSAAENGHCVHSPVDHVEIRVSSNNWEAVFFQAWMIQIILSEMLDVPVSVETGKPGLSVDMYDISSSMDYGSNGDWESLQRAREVGDCRKLKTENESEYQACSHVNPEFWPNGYINVYPEEVLKGNIEPPSANGGVAEQFWYVPRFTAERDPSLLSHLGLGSIQSRHKVASTFKFPTTWKDYCNEVSKNNCTTDDGVAKRPPEEGEESVMFKEVFYTGHFRLTEKNDCVKHPKNCTGFIADYPCSWWTYTPQQTYHNNIPLDSLYWDGGEMSYSQLTQIWAAANATKSDVIMMWWNPDILFQKYLGTDAEFTRVQLPTPTQSCVDNRMNNADRCGANWTLRVGDPQGACDYIPEVVQKAISTGLWEVTHDPDTPEALWSPGYDVVKNLQISSLQIGDIIDYWIERGTDLYGFDPRDATCRWVVENMDVIESFIPQSYPRVVEELSVSGSSLHMTAQIVAAVAVLVVAIASFLVVQRRGKKTIHYAQIEFLLLILLGMLLIAVGSLVLAVPPNDMTCLTVVWMTSLGYVLLLVPLIIRIFAINQLINTGKHMKRIRLRRKRLLGQVFGVCNIICGFLIVWTLLDPPKVVVDYQLTEKVTDLGERVITANDYCDSDYSFWNIVDLSWQAFFVFSAAVLSFLAGRATEDMNGVKSLAMLIYTQLAFVAARAVSLIIHARYELDNTDMMAYHSMLLSAECIVAVIIFFVPKISDNNEDDQSEQVADIFLNTSIIMANITGFPAWCSLREPTQVFTFLEEVYSAFDEIGENYHVFKVECTGSCYVGATGLPTPSADHAVDMAKFAVAIMGKMKYLTKQLEVLYGPDTTDLGLRIGIHSGPVTGGFLRGKGARFQLFGDTMNTCELVQSTSETKRIQVSEATAELLKQAGRHKWVNKRDGKIQIKGRPELQTYWLERTKRPGLLRSFSSRGSASSLGCSSGFGDETTLREEDEVGFSPERTARLVDWNTKVLGNLLIQILSRRNTSENYSTRKSTVVNSGNMKSLSLKSIAEPTETGTDEGKMPIEEVNEIITLPEFDATAIKRTRDAGTVELPVSVQNQLKDYVAAIAGMYRQNYFHNFEHASHVVMAVTKHMSRIVAPADVDLGTDEARLRRKTAATLHDHTYGITSDPLTQFACVFSALIHDVDHPGVPNPQLIKEDECLAALYQERSVAEQNSFDLAWDLLMEDRFRDLQETIFCNHTEKSRFRQLVINSVMATDLGDKELKALRNNRWDKAFHLNEHSQAVESEDQQLLENSRDDINRKATIVIEHLIQASDVSHTMQHWHVYRKWNEQLFKECYEAYAKGRAANNPADGWYKGEIGFFDFYIIPLAKKLDNCGVFGIGSDENLSYALANRAEWEAQGEAVVEEMVQKVLNTNGTIEEVSCEDSSFGDEVTLASTEIKAEEV